MLTDGIKLTEGSDIVNDVVASGTSFPTLPNSGELFFRTDSSALHVYDGATWVQVGLTSSQLNGQPGSYYLNNANATGLMSVSNGGTGASTAFGARANFGLMIGSAVQAWDGDLDSIAGLTGLTGLLRKTAANTWSLDTTSYLPTTGGTIVGNLTMTGSILPSANITYNLGSPTMMWKDIYVGPGSIYMNGKKILEDVSNTIIFSTDINQNLRVATSGTGNLEFQTDSTGSVLMKSTMTLTSGRRIIDSAGIKVEFGSAIELNGNKITGLGTPTNAGDGVTKAYADSIGTAATNAATLTSGIIADARIAASSVTQHQAALTIAETQITNGALLARNADNETITGTWSYNNPITVGTPSANSHAATKAYVDAIASGVNPQLAVRAATTGNITLGGLQTIDGVALIAGNRILVKDQATSVLNGVYVVASGSWARSADFDGAPTTEVATGDLVFVSEGTINANASFILITAGTIVVDTTPLTFSVFSRAGDLIAGTGLTRTGQSIDVIGTVGRIVANADSIDLATAGTAGTYTSVTTDAYGRVTAGSTPATTLTGDVTGTGTSTVTTTLASVGTAGTYRSVTTDVKGRVIGGTNPTTLTGYGITDAQPLNTDLSAIAALTTTGIHVRSAAGTHTTRSIAVLGTGLSITSADGVGGNPTITISSATANSVSTLVARDATGSFSAGNITANLTGNATSATSAVSSAYIVVGDTRSVATGPNVGVSQIRADFKTNALDGLNDGGTYHGVVTFQQYGDPSGGGTRQLGFTDNDNLWLRGSGTALTSYGAWKLMLNSTNFSTYAPTLTGTGATGTWGIAITGNAASVGGLGISTSAVANTIVIRDSANYSYFNYINSNTANNENPVISQVITSNGTDNFYRKNSIASFGSQVGPSITSLGNIVTINGFSPANGSIRLTPNLHLNSMAGSAVILNWDNGGSGATQAVRIGNGAGTDAWSITHAGNSTQVGNVTSGGTVFASAGGGFASSTYAVNARNPIWRFGNADGYGLSYFQGTSGIAASDSIGFHFGSVTAAGSVFNVSSTALTSTVPLNVSNNLNLTAGTSQIKIGPNTTWASTLYVGGDGVNGITRAGNTASVVTTDGNLHLDPGTTKATYLNFYSGTSGITFGNGAMGVVGTMTSLGVLSMASFTGAGTGLTGTAASLNIGGNAATASNSTLAAGLTPSTFFRYEGFTLDANTMPSSRSGFTYSLNAPHTGPIAFFDASNYGLQLNAQYSNAGTISFRTKNGDTNTWNAWSPILTPGNFTSYAPSLTGSGASGTWSINVAGNAGTVTSLANRTDSIAYPIVWNTSGGASINYSCAAVTITSSTGTINASALNGVLTGNAINQSINWTGYNYFSSNKGSASTVGISSTYNLEAHSTDGGAAAMSFHRAGFYAVNMGLDPDNVFRIGGWSASANLLQMTMAGALTMAGDITAFSDIRVKKNITVIDNALAKVEAIRGVTFERSDNDSNQRHAGVIAQEVELVLPEVVSESADGIKAVAYGNMVGLLIEAIKELSAQNKALVIRLEALEDK